MILEDLEVGILGLGPGGSRPSMNVFCPYHDCRCVSQVLKQKAWVSVDRHSHSLDDVRLIKHPVRFTSHLLDTSHSFTFGLPKSQLDSPVGHSYYPAKNSGKPTFYGRRSTNCLSLDTLGDEQLLEFIL